MRDGMASEASKVLGASRVNNVGIQGNVTAVQDSWIFPAATIPDDRELYSTALIVPGNSGILEINIYRKDFECALEVYLGFSEEEARGDTARRQTLIPAVTATANAGVGDIMLSNSSKARRDIFLHKTNKARELVLKFGAQVTSGNNSTTQVQAGDIITAQIYFINL